MSSMSKADEATLSSMHGLFAEVLLHKLRTGDLEKGDLNVIRQFLKDNAIDCYGPANATLGAIADELPSFNDEADADVMCNVISLYGKDTNDEVKYG